MTTPGWIPFGMWKLFNITEPFFTIHFQKKLIYYQGTSISFCRLREMVGITIDGDGGWSYGNGSYCYGFCPALK